MLTPSNHREISAAQRAADILFNVSWTKAQNGEKRFALFTILSYLRRANSSIELMFYLRFFKY